MSQSAASEPLLEAGANMDLEASVSPDFDGDLPSSWIQSEAHRGSWFVFSFAYERLHGQAAVKKEIAYRKSSFKKDVHENKWASYGVLSILFLCVVALIELTATRLEVEKHDPMAGATLNSLILCVLAGLVAITPYIVYQVNQSECFNHHSEYFEPARALTRHNALQGFLAALLMVVFNLFYYIQRFYVERLVHDSEKDDGLGWDPDALANMFWLQAVLNTLSIYQLSTRGGLIAPFACAFAFEAFAYITLERTLGDQEWTYTDSGFIAANIVCCVFICYHVITLDWNKREDYLVNGSIELLHDQYNISNHDEDMVYKSLTSIVQRATNKHTRRLVALKFVKDKERFNMAKEAFKLTDKVGHPELSLYPVYAIPVDRFIEGLDQGSDHKSHPLLVMPYGGRNLRDSMAAESFAARSVEKIQSTALQIGESLRRLHGLRLIHGELKDDLFIPLRFGCVPEQ